MAEIKSLLDGVIETEIQNLGSLSSGSDEKSKAIRDIATLHKLRIEEIKAETEADEKCERREMDSEQRKAELALKEKQAEQQETQQNAELNLKERELDSKNADRAREEELQNRQARNQVIDRCVGTCLEVGKLVLPLMCYGIWMNRGFKFEETGAFTSTTFKNLLNRFRPTK